MTAGIARIVFGNSGFDFADQVSADVGRLGIDTAAQLGEERDERCAETVADDCERNLLRIMAERFKQRVKPADAE